MKTTPLAITLIVMGALVILVPVFVSAYSRATNKENVAEYYRRNSLGMPLPEAMQPAGTGPYAWACWVAGAGMVVAGVRKSRVQTSSDNA